MAAPVTRATLAAALAARSSPLDRRAVALPAPVGERDDALEARPTRSWLPPPPGPFVFRVAAGAPVAVGVVGTGSRVPDVRGASARDAAAELHAAGFRVALEGVGAVRAMEPRAGSVAERGKTVRLMLGGSR
jgi:hypothetical protein